VKVHQIKQTQQLPISLTEAWEFFSTPANLLDLTPTSMQLTAINQPAEKMYPGMISTYELKPVPGVKFTWVTEITHIEDNVRFVDEQRSGPFRFWHHEHALKEIQGGTEVTDTLHYAIPFHFAGEIANKLFIEKEIHAVFAYRYYKLKEKFGAFHVG
jgi:ligand-binding SRPBCC domain-containing protein